MNDDEILAINVDELIKRFKELGCWTYCSNDPDKVIVVGMIAQAVEKIAYAKGVKRGKSIGSHAAYSHFLKHGRWIEGCPTDTTDYFNCSVCNAGIFVNNLWRVSYEDVSEIHRFCLNCGAKMDGMEE